MPFTDWLDVPPKLLQYVRVADRLSTSKQPAIGRVRSAWLTQYVSVPGAHGGQQPAAFLTVPAPQLDGRASTSVHVLVSVEVCAAWLLSQYVRVAERTSRSVHVLLIERVVVLPMLLQ